MTVHRRQLLGLATSAAVISTFTTPVWGQTFPSRPIRWLSGFAAGGPGDVIQRVVAQFLHERLGQPVVIDRQPGASGTLALQTIARSAPDGYSLSWLVSADAINVTLRPSARSNVVRDIAPIAALAQVPNVLAVIPSLQVKTVPEFIAHAKANPGKMNLGSAGAGTVVHVTGELFKMMTEVNIVQVQYAGTTPAVVDMLGGRVDAMFGNMPSVLQHIREGKLRALAVTTASRSQFLPEVPTVAETVPGFEASTWFGVGAPRQTPSDIIDKLNKEIGLALADPTVKARIADVGGAPMPMSPPEFEKFVAADAEKWAKVIRAANIKEG